MHKKFDPAKTYCMALTNKNTICLYPSASGTTGICGRSDTSCTVEKMTAGRGIIELMALVKTQGGNCSFVASMEAYLAEVKDRAVRNERMEVAPGIHEDEEVGVEPKVNLQVIVGDSLHFCIDI